MIGHRIEREFIGHCAARNLGEKLNRLEVDRPGFFALKTVGDGCAKAGRE